MQTQTKHTVVDTLTKYFQNASSDDMGKEFGDVVNTANKGIAEFDLFFQAKPYRKKFGATSTDRDRYNAFMSALVTFAKTTGKLDKCVSNADLFSVKLATFLQSDDVFAVLKDDFNKSYKTMAPKLAKLLKPSAGLNVPGSDALFLHNFAVMLESSDDLYFYVSSTIPSTDLEDVALQYVLRDHCLMVLNTSPDDVDTSFSSFWISDKKIVNDRMAQLSPAQYMAMLYSFRCDLNILHFVSFDTLKRDMVAKSYDKLRSHVKLLNAKGCTLYAYKAVYKYSDGYNEFDENQIGNSVSGFYQSYEDYSSDAMGSFVFNGTLGNVCVETYWLMTSEYVNVLRTKTMDEPVDMDDDPADPSNDQPDEQASEQVDADVKKVADGSEQVQSALPDAPEPHTFFDWTPITIEEFVCGLNDEGTLGRTYLH